MKSERGLTNGSLEPVKPKTIKIIKRKKLIKLIKTLIEFKSIEEIKLKRLKNYFISSEEFANKCFW